MQRPGEGGTVWDVTPSIPQTHRRPLGKSRSALSEQLTAWSSQQSDGDLDPHGFELIRTEVVPVNGSRGLMMGSVRIPEEAMASQHSRRSLDSSARPSGAAAAVPASCQASPARRVPLRRATMSHPIAQDQAFPLEEDIGHEAFDAAFVPPHLLSASLPIREAALNDPFQPGSVMIGNGRKLKGYDADRFKRSIMRQTGFLEAL